MIFDYLLAVMVLAGLAALFNYFVVRPWSLRRSGKLVAGQTVTVTGVVQPVMVPLTAPLSGRACVLHRSRARVFTRDAIPQLVAEPVELAATAFMILTRNGTVVIEATPELKLVPAALVERLEARELAFLARHDHAADQRVNANFDEIVIAPGNTVTVRGTVDDGRHASAAAEQSDTGSSPQPTRLISSAGTPLTILRMW